MRTAEARKLKGAHADSKPGAAFGSMTYETKPDHVRALGECLMVWTTAETYLAVLFSALLRANSDATIAVYSTLRRNTPRHDAIAKAADHILRIEGKKIVEALLMHVSSIDSQRNDLAHGWRGVSFDIEDGLACISQEHMTITHVDFNKKFLKTSSISSSGFNKYFDNLRDKVFIYRLKDFLDLKKEINELIVIISEFRAVITMLRGEPPFFLGKKEADKLKGFAPIREALEVLRLREERRNQRERPPKPPQPDPM